MIWGKKTFCTPTSQIYLAHLGIWSHVAFSLPPLRHTCSHNWIHTHPIHRADIWNIRSSNCEIVSACYQTISNTSLIAHDGRWCEKDQRLSNIYIYILLEEFFVLGSSFYAFVRLQLPVHACVELTITKIQRRKCAPMARSEWPSGLLFIHAKTQCLGWQGLVQPLTRRGFAFKP